MSRPIIGMKIRGDKALQMALRQLGDVVGKRAAGRVQRKALKAGGSPILMEAKRRAPRSKRRVGDLSRPGGRPGNLKRSLAVSRGRRVRRYPRGNILAILGPQWPLGAHGHLVEFGTKQRRTKTGASRGRMPARPFLEPAFHGRIREARAKIRQVFGKEIAREWDKHIRKGAR